MKLAASRVHFIGIGGIGMCGLAELLHNMGAEVTGSDLANNAQTKRLAEMGIKVFTGHRPENIGQAEVVVYSSAVKTDNSELVQARRQKIPVIPRAEALAEIMRLKRGVAVGGTHGKTTTTSLAASVFIEAQKSPTIVVGGRLDKIKSTAQLGSGDWMIAEADESDGSFALLSPEIVIITNIDNDHLDHYKTFDRLKEAFFQFALRIPFYGTAIVCGDDPVVRELFKDFPKKIIFYGFDSQNDYVLKGERGNYSIQLGDQPLGSFQIPMAGKHNALNASAAMIAGLEAGIDFQTAAKGIAGFNGVDRRFQWKGQKDGVDFYDDYGHHPTEIECVLRAFREKHPDRRLKVIFQPHRYSRTQSCWSQFLTCFSNCDEVFILDIYPAGEAPLQGIDSAKLVEQIDHACCRYLNRQDVISTVGANLKSGDVLITLGAGDVWKLGEELLR